MAAWGRILQDQELISQVKHIYEQDRGPTFPIEIRHALAEWIEHYFGASCHLDDNDSNTHESIRDLMLNMSAEMERKINCGPCPAFENRDISHISNILRQWINNIRINCPDQIVLFQHIQQRLQLEIQLLNRAVPIPMSSSPPLLSSTSSSSSPTRPAIPIRPEILQLESALVHFQNNQLRELGATFDRLQQCQQELNSILENFGAGPPSFVGMNELELKENEFRNLHHDMYSQTQACIFELKTLLDKVLREIGNWKMATKLNYEGKPWCHPTPLDKQAQLVNSLAKLMWGIRDIIKNGIMIKTSLHTCLAMFSTSNSSDLVDTTQFEEFKSEAEKMLQNLVFNSTIVRDQPYQMLKTDTKFKTTVQLLVGDQAFCLPQLKIFLLTDRQAFNILRNTDNCGQMHDTGEGSSSRCLGVCQPVLEQDIIGDNSATVKITTDKEYCAFFKTPKILKEFKRNIEKDVREISRSIIDVNHFIYYSGQFEAHGVVFKIGMFSYPVKVITNIKQEQKCWETSIWDLAMGSLVPGQAEGRKPPAQWNSVINAVSVCFLRQTGRGLDHENIDFIVQTLLPKNLADKIRCDPSTFITLEQFCTDHVGAGRNFTLWEWLFGVMKLITENLRGERNKCGGMKNGIWDFEYVMGMVTAEKTQDLLHRNRWKIPGGFVLRFSPNVLNTITIEWIQNDHIFCTRITRKDLIQRSLGDRLLDLENLQMLYKVDCTPVAKKSVFKYSASQGSIPPPRETILPSGSVIVQYVRNVLRAHVQTNNMATPASVRGPSSSKMALVK